MKKVLLVDDDELLTEFLREYFGESGIGLDSTSSPQKAVSLSMENEYAIVLVDVRLSKHDGTALASDLVRIRGDKNLYLFTAKDKKWMTDNNNIGLPILHKPFTVEELDDIIRSAGIDVEAESVKLTL
jgi:DNA-binding response OmpR family regulator